MICLSSYIGLQATANAYKYVSDTEGVYYSNVNFAPIFKEILDDGAFIMTGIMNINRPEVAEVIRKSEKKLYISQKSLMSFFSGLYVRIGQPWERDYNMFLR